MSNLLDVISALQVQDAPFRPYFNTGTMFDYGTGDFVPGKDGSTVLNGGFAGTNSVAGRAQLYKSSLSSGIEVNALARYPNSQLVIKDSEWALRKKRVIRASNLFLDNPELRQKHLEELEARIVINTPDQFTGIEDWFEKVVIPIVEYKLKHRKDFTVESPILDPKTLKPLLMLIPTFVAIDSWTEAKSSPAETMLDKHGSADPESNMFWMRDGNVKSKLLHQMTHLAAKANIIFVLTAHIGDNKTLDGGRAPPTKELQYMKQADKIKGAGSGWHFLISNALQCMSATVLQDEHKECEYPYPNDMTGPTEMSEINTVILRNKNNAAGTSFPFVSSQTNSLDIPLTNFNYLRRNDYFGLGTNKAQTRPYFTPDTTISRKSATARILDYKVSRGIEILAQLKFVQNCWSLRQQPVPYDITPEALAEFFVSKPTYALDDILNSRGWWTYGTHERNYLSLFDILAIVAGLYKPKFLSLYNPAKK